MSVIKIYKFRDIEECNIFMQGGILGGQIPLLSTGGLGYEGIVGKTLQFTSPAAVTHTFIAGTAAGGALSFSDLKTQLEAAVSGLLVYQFGGQVVFIESSPSGGVLLKADNGAGANRYFGFDSNNDTAGVVYGSPYGDGPTAPYWMTAYSDSNNMHVIHTFE